jgi:hypothetical protein
VLERDPLRVPVSGGTIRRRGVKDSSSDEWFAPALAALEAPVASIGELSLSSGVGLSECSRADILVTRPPPRTDMPVRSLLSAGPSAYDGGICFIVAGWLNTLVAGLLERLLRSRIHPKMINASSARAPSTAPITMPAICPPVSPRCAAAAEGVGSPVGVISPLVVSVVTISDKDDDAITGNTTFSHRCSVSENTQQESVALGEFDEQ